MAIVNIGTKEAYDLVNIPKMKEYLLSVKNNQKTNPQSKSVYGYMTDQEFAYVDSNDPSKYIGTIPGSVSIHVNGEMDIRGVYCSLVVADILNLLQDNT